MEMLVERLYGYTVLVLRKVQKQEQRLRPGDIVDVTIKWIRYDEIAAKRTMDNAYERWNKKNRAEKSAVNLANRFKQKNQQEAKNGEIPR